MASQAVSYQSLRDHTPPPSNMSATQIYGPLRRSPTESNFSALADKIDKGNRPPSPSRSLANRIRRVCSDGVQAIWNSKICRPLIIVAAKVAIVAFLGFLHFFPPTWVVDLLLICLVVGGFLTAGSGLECLVTDKGPCKNFKQTFKNIFYEDLLAEIGNLCRRTFKQSYSEIVLDLPNKKEGQGRLILGALPNRTVLTAEQLKYGIGENDEVGIDAVLSINSPAERKPRLSMIPNTDEDYRDVGIEYTKIDLRDHVPLSPAQLNKAADTIHNAISNGRNIYVHCKAGNGRSGMAIAAYLIKYQGMSVNQACAHVVKYRPKSTVQDKTHIIEGSRLVSTTLFGKKTTKLETFYDLLRTNQTWKKQVWKPNKPTSSRPINNEFPKSKEMRKNEFFPHSVSTMIPPSSSFIPKSLTYIMD